ncbi:MAG: PilW family protein [Gammaproteobacteria bacterium]|nr:PilW family protein [Gammaproteobacteria bacterium]
MKRIAHGFSLVELMISLALGSVVTVGVIQLFTANSESYNLLQGQSRMQESARFAMNFIGRSARSAGYSGCFSSVEDMHTTLNAAFVPYSYDLRSGVQGYNSTVGSSVWSPALTSLPRSESGTDTNVYTVSGSDLEAGNGIDTNDVVDGTDVLTLRNMSTEDHRLVADLPTSTEPVVVGSTIDELDLSVDELAMIHDCEKATIFRVTSLSESGGQTTIGHDLADTDNFRNTLEKLAQVNTYQDDAAVSKIETNTFFIAPGAGFNSSGNKPLSLWRKRGIEAPVELVEGVENMQVRYGIDTDLDETPNRYAPANEVVDWNAVSTIRVSLVVNSIDEVGGSTEPTHTCSVQDCIPDESIDGLIRRSFTQTFQLRN